MSKVWLTSDLHLGHKLVAGHRGFSDVAEHDIHVLDELASTVSPGDQLWILGDLSMNPNHGLGLINGIRCHKHLITGNHDHCHPMHRDAYKAQRKYLEVFESVQLAARRRIAGQSVLLSHLPYTIDRGFEARYPQWRLPDLGEFILHGHTHSKDIWTSDKEIHVGWDTWYRPVELHEIEEMIAGKVK